MCGLRSPCGSLNFLDVRFAQEKGANRTSRKFKLQMPTGGSRGVVRSNGPPIGIEVLNGVLSEMREKSYQETARRWP